MNLLLIDESIPKLDLFKSGINDNTKYLFYSIEDTFESINKKIIDLGLDSFEYVGFVFVDDMNIFKRFAGIETFISLDNNDIKENNTTNFIKDLVANYNVKYLDFLACNLLSYPIWKKYFDFLMNQSTGLIVRASNDRTGNLNIGGDWALESTNENIFNLYFNDNLKKWNNLLDLGQDYISLIGINGELLSLGYDIDGNLGIGVNNNTLINNFKKSIDSSGNYINNVISNSQGCYHQSIIKSDGTVWSTGQNYYGVIGDGSYIDRNVFVRSIDNSNNQINDAIMVSTGEFHTVILKKDGTVWSSGRNNNGQLGLNNYVDTNKFTQADISDAKYISCGGNSTYIIKNDNTLWVCGLNDYKQLGLGWTSPNKINSFQKVDISNVKIIDAGHNHAVLLTNDDKLYSVGNNINGESGAGIPVYYPVFTELTNISNIKSIACGAFHSVLLKNDGSIMVTGRNMVGDIGIGISGISMYRFNEQLPIDISNNYITDVTDIFAGRSCTIIIRNNETIWISGQVIYSPPWSPSQYNALDFGNKFAPLHTSLDDNIYQYFKYFNNSYNTNFNENIKYLFPIKKITSVNTVGSPAIYDSGNNPIIKFSTIVDNNNNDITYFYPIYKSLNSYSINKIIHNRSNNIFSAMTPAIPIPNLHDIFSNDGAVLGLTNDVCGNSVSFAGNYNGFLLFQDMYNSKLHGASRYDDPSGNYFGFEGPQLNAKDLSNIEHIYNNGKTFCALRKNGTVKVWGSALHGGSQYNIIRYGIEYTGPDGSFNNSVPLSGIQKIVSNSSAYCALKNDGTVQVWGDPFYGGVQNNVSSTQYIYGPDQSGNKLENVIDVFPSNYGFYALYEDTNNSITNLRVWGSKIFGISYPDGSYNDYNYSGVITDLSNVRHIYPSYNSVTVLFNDSSIKTFGFYENGGSILGISSEEYSGWKDINNQNTNIMNVFSNGNSLDNSSFCSLNKNKKISVWGSYFTGGSKNIDTDDYTSIRDISGINFHNIYSNGVSYCGVGGNNNTIFSWGCNQAGGSEYKKIIEEYGPSIELTPELSDYNFTSINIMPSFPYRLAFEVTQNSKYIGKSLNKIIFPPNYLTTDNYNGGNVQIEIWDNPSFTNNNQITSGGTKITESNIISIGNTLNTEYIFTLNNQVILQSKYFIVINLYFVGNIYIKHNTVNNNYTDLKSYETNNQNLVNIPNNLLLKFISEKDTNYYGFKRNDNASINIKTVMAYGSDSINSGFASFSVDPNSSEPSGLIRSWGKYIENTDLSNTKFHYLYAKNCVFGLEFDINDTSIIQNALNTNNLHEYEKSLKIPIIRKYALNYLNNNPEIEIKFTASRHKNPKLKHGTTYHMKIHNNGSINYNNNEITSKKNFHISTEVGEPIQISVPNGQSYKLYYNDTFIFDNNEVEFIVSQDNAIFAFDGINHYEVNKIHIGKQIFDLSVGSITQSYSSCFVKGTKVLTTKGYISVENLKDGDIVITDKLKQKKCEVYKYLFKLNEDSYPVLIPRHSIDNNYPQEDLIISQKHPVYYKNQWILPKRHLDKFSFKLVKETHILNNICINNKFIEYYLVCINESESHNIIINNGIVVKSYNNNDKLYTYIRDKKTGLYNRVLSKNITKKKL